jgi:hypothetical protein
MVMIFMALILWGILAVQLIHPVNERLMKNNPGVYDGCARCPRAFSSVFHSALTFWKQLVAGDSWGQLSEPIIEEAKWTSVFFVLVLVTVDLMLLNLILSVIVEAGAAAAAQCDATRAVQSRLEVEKAEDRLVHICAGLDADNSGALSIHEFTKGFTENDEFRECLQVMHVTESDMQMLFDILDEDDSGDVDYREFVEQIRRIKFSGEQMLLRYVAEVRTLLRRARKAASGSFGLGDMLDVQKSESKDHVGARGKHPMVPTIEEAQLPLLSGGKLPSSQTKEHATIPMQVASMIVNQHFVNQHSESDSNNGTPRHDMPDDGNLERIIKLNEEMTAILAGIQSTAQCRWRNTPVDGSFGRLGNSELTQPKSGLLSPNGSPMAAKARLPIDGKPQSSNQALPCEPVAADREQSSFLTHFNL